MGGVERPGAPEPGNAQGAERKTSAADSRRQRPNVDGPLLAAWLKARSEWRLRRPGDLSPDAERRIREWGRGDANGRGHGSHPHRALRPAPQVPGVCLSPPPSSRAAANPCRSPSPGGASSGVAGRPAHGRVKPVPHRAVRTAPRRPRRRYAGPPRAGRRFGRRPRNAGLPRRASRSHGRSPSSSETGV
jgi:hypothetical protein